MSTNKRQFTMRMQPENFDKLRVISAMNKRSVAMQTEYLIEKCIAEHEKKFGKITLVDDPESQQAQVIQNNHNGNNIFSQNLVTNS